MKFKTIIALLALGCLSAPAADLKISWQYSSPVPPTHFVIEYKQDTNVPLFPAASVSVAFPATSVVLKNMREGIAYVITVRAVIVSSSSIGTGPVPITKFSASEPMKVYIPVSSDKPAGLTAEIIPTPDN